MASKDSFKHNDIAHAAFVCNNLNKNMPQLELRKWSGLIRGKVKKNILFSSFNVSCSLHFVLSNISSKSHLFAPQKFLMFYAGDHKKVNRWSTRQLPVIRSIIIQFFLSSSRVWWAAREELHISSWIFFLLFVLK